MFAALFGLGRLQPLIDYLLWKTLMWTASTRCGFPRRRRPAGVRAAGRGLGRGPRRNDPVLDAAYTAGGSREFSHRPAAVASAAAGSAALPSARPLCPTGVDDSPPSPRRRHPDRPTASRHRRRCTRRFAAGGGAGRQKFDRHRGGWNAGKTTLLRALAAEFDALEKVVVLEKEAELGLDRLPHRHAPVVAWQAREANAEGAGQVSLAELMTHALRMNARRILVGEVRGDELIPMLTAMGSGNPGVVVHAARQLLRRRDQPHGLDWS